MHRFFFQSILKFYSGWIYKAFLFQFFSLSNFFLSPLTGETNASVAAGENHSLLLRTDGSLWSMGKNDRGQLGNGSELERGLVGWWKFDGDATDSSGNGNDGTVNGATLTTDRHGLANGAYSFDGVNDYIQVPHHDSLSLKSFTLSIWFNSTAIGSRSMLLKDNHTGNNYGLWFLSDSTVISQCYYNDLISPFQVYSNSLSLNQTYFLCSTYRDNELVIYIDGVEQSSLTSSEDPEVDNEPLYFGYDGGFGYDNFQGTLDNIRIYNRALSSTEVSDLYTLESQPFSHQPARVVDENVTAIASGSETSYFIKNDGSLWGMGRNDHGQLGNAQGLDQGLVGWWKFDGDATDSSGNGNDGTVNGATLTTDRHGQANGAYSFDGVDDYILVPHNSSLDFNKNDPHTISVWVYAFNSSHSGSIMEKWVSASAAPYPYVIRFSNDVISHLRYDGVSSPSLSFSSALLSTEFVHVTFSSDGSTRSLFSNGVLVDSGPVTGGLGPISNSDDLYIGKRGGISVRNFNGLIDDIRIYNRALSASEISALYILESQPEDPSASIQIVDSNVTAVSSHGSHALFQKTDGSLWAMGANEYGQLGDGTTTDRHTPVKIVDGNVTALSAGGDHSRFVQADGSLWAMGRNHVGQLGDGTTSDRASPVKVVNSGVANVASGLSHGYYLTTGGDLWAMGLNADGQLGDGTTTNRNSPVQVLDGSNVSQVSAGSKEGFFTKSDGTTWAMGRNDFGQLGNGSTTDVRTPARLLTWKQNQSISKPRKVYSGAELLNGKIYLAGGFDGNSSADFESYDPILNQWSSLPSLSEGLIGSMTGTLDGKIYSIGGATQVSNQGDGNLSGDSFYLYAIDGISDELLVIDPDDGNFSIVGDLGVDFNSLSTMDYNSVDGKLYANAGYDFYSIDISNGVATKVSTMPRATGNPSISFHDDGRLFVHYEVGGPPHGTGYYYNDVNFNGEVTVGSHPSFRNIFAVELDGTGKIWSANQETSKLGRSNGTNYASEWVGSGSVQQVPLDLDIDSGNVIRLVSGLFPWSGSDSAVANLCELNSITGSSDKTFIFSRAHIGSLASTPLSALSKRQVPQSIVRIYDPVSNQWGDGPNLPSAIHRGSVVSLSDRILILGGLDSENNRTGETYELLSGSPGWTVKANMPTSRSATASVVLDGKVWVIGGIDFSWSDKVEIFDPSTNSWTSGPSLNSPRVSPVAWVSSGILYVAGGYDGVDYLDSVESYDPVSNSWSIMGTLPHSIYQSDAVFTNEEVFLVGGETNASRFPATMTTLNSSPLTFASGNSHSILIKQDGTFWGMGRNDSGQIGDGSLTDRSYPVPIISSYILVVNGAPEGNATGGGEWSIGTPVTLTATPNPGYLFAGWVGDLNSTDANVILSPTGNLEVNATFTQDLNDNDDDNLTNFYEIVTLGTNADNNDTDGDGLLDGEEVGILGIDPLINNAPIVALFAQREIDAYNTGLSEGNTSGQQYVYDYRSTFSLYNQGEVNASAQQRESNGSLAGEPLGRLYVQTNPGEFSLYTEADLNASMASERVRGLADGNQSGKNQVTANPSFYGLYTETEINATIASESIRGLADGNASGKAYVQTKRVIYSLYNGVDLNVSGTQFYSNAYTEGNTSGINYVNLNPNLFNLYTETDINNSRILSQQVGFNEGNLSGIAYLQANARQYGWYHISDKLQLEADARIRALVDGNTAGVNQVKNNPHSYDLNTTVEKETAEAFARSDGLNKGFSSGVQWAVDHPSLYSLYLPAEKVSLENSAYDLASFSGVLVGKDYVVNNRKIFDWINPVEKTEMETNASRIAREAGRLSGIKKVKNSPNDYSLYSLADRNQKEAQAYSVGVTEGNASGIAYVFSNRLSYGLSADIERDARILDSRQRGESEGIKAGRAQSVATAQADLSRHGLALVEYLETTEPTPYTYNWFYQPGAGWLWTDKSVFPYFYLSSSEGTQTGWLYYDSNRTDFPFYDYEKKTWKEIEP